MSLTKFITIPEVKDKFAETFTLPDLGSSPKLICPPKTKHYGLVGTAFDYLLRFTIEIQNNNTQTGRWVAEAGVERVRDTPDFKRCNTILQKAKVAYNKYISTKKLNDDIIGASLLLAQLDLAFRPGIIDPNLGKIDKLDVEDLRNLMKCTKPNLFKAKRVCILNPKFGAGSMLVGGADADMIIDDTLIEIKTVKDFKLDRRYYDQLIGYYILSMIDKIDDCETDVKINNLAIYFSRYAKFVNLKVSDVTKGVDMKKFKSWFEKKALSNGLATISFSSKVVENLD
jgi:hypothetical protein